MFRLYSFLFSSLSHYPRLLLRFLTNVRELTPPPPPPKKKKKKKKKHTHTKKTPQKNKTKTNKLMFAIIQLKFGKTHLDRHQRHSDDIKCCSKCTLVCTSLIQPKRCKSSKRLETGGAPSGAAPPPPTTPYPSYTLHLLARRERNCLADTNVIAQFQGKVQATGKRRGRLYGRLVRHASPQPPPFVGTVPKSLVCYPIVTFYTAVFFRWISLSVPTTKWHACCNTRTDHSHRWSVVRTANPIAAA